MPTDADITAILGHRQVQIMQYLWAHGPATVRQVWTSLKEEQPIAYTTVMTVCQRLFEKGLLERRRTTSPHASGASKLAHEYVPQLDEATLLRQAQNRLIDSPYPQLPGILHHSSQGCDRPDISRLLAYLNTLRTPDGQPIDRQALDTIAALLHRAEAAEQAAHIHQAEAVFAERRAEALNEQLTAARQNRRAARAKRVPSTLVEAAYEFSGRDKVCRVCGRPAPPPAAGRHDDLRVCRRESCRKEARRRDNVIKQRRALARKRAQEIQ